MFFQSIAHINCRRSGQLVRLASAALVLVLAICTQSSAEAPVSTGKVMLSSASTHPGNHARDTQDVADVKLNDRTEEHLTGTAIFSNTTSSQTGTDASPAAESAGSETPPLTASAQNRSPDWNGIWRDTAIMFGAQTLAVSVLYVMPENVSGWSDEKKEEQFKNYPEHFTNPVIDDDKLYLNYILHPYWGAAYYIRGRERGLGRVPSLVYSALLSAMYEFGIECIFEYPSIQDLIVTPVGGALVGALIFEPWRDSIRRKNELHWYDHAALVLTDPIGVLSRGIETLFGIKSTIMVDYSIPQAQNRSGRLDSAAPGSRINVTLHVPLN
jgi:hypothetical protein